MIELHNIDCMEYMKGLDDDVFDLTVTSPPYDNLRTYKDSLEWSEDIWKSIIKELYRVTKKGGVVVWVVGDATIKGSETGTSFKQALWAMECGFNLHDTMIYHKNTLPKNHNRYEQDFEYMFIFSKGKPKHFKPIKIPCAYAGTNPNGTFRHDGENASNAHQKKKVKEEKIKGNIWRMPNGYKQGTLDDVRSHPATFPEKLANDQIISWANQGDIVFDPFMGSGTTGKMAVKNGRSFVGCEKVKEYFEISKERIKTAQIDMF